MNFAKGLLLPLSISVNMVFFSFFFLFFLLIACLAGWLAWIVIP